MMNGCKRIILLFTLLITTQAVADDPALATLFEKEGVDGTLVITSINSGETYIHNNRRSVQRFAVASTFKILNTLIALEEKAVSGDGMVFQWDGHVYDYTAWNRDQSLETAFKASCVWCYQVLARRIGTEKYREYLRNAEYGELHEPVVLTNFWLDGSLKNSAMEQVEFLKKVYFHALPFSEDSYKTLRKIMQVEQTPSYSMWAKSGWATDVEPQVGWYVGYVETEKDVWFFAMNMRIKKREDLSHRQTLTRKALTMHRIIK